MHLQTLSEQLSLNTGLQLEGENTTCFGLKARIPFSLHAIRLGGGYEKRPTLWCYFPLLFFMLNVVARQPHRETTLFSGLGYSCARSAG